jgi:hypothetical protein
MCSSVVFLRENLSVHEINISAQPKYNLLRYTVPLHAHSQTEFTEKCFISHETKDQTVFHLLYDIYLTAIVYTKLVADIEGGT